MRLKDKVVLITGGYTGIGKAIAQTCVKEGAKVAINGLRDALGGKLVDELGTENAVHFTKDITEKDAAADIIEQTLSTFGKLDGLVNNAALISSSNLQTTSVDFLQKMLEVNTIAPFALIQAALPYLEKNHGCVLNIGSINAWCGEPDLLAYSMSKGALMTMSRNLGDTLFRNNGVRVNQINPGWVLTENEIENKRNQGMKDDWFTELPDIFAPAQRLFAPEEIATAAVYLLSDQSGPVSGQVLELEQFPMIGRNPPKVWTDSHKNN
ncbi:SDR family NAD(P)-dependent oxidoreductase [Pareuzebyella sediminis]|uniref:SDR family NAD(P)-dependent oxidoreductase n=1 Tax=Pareuzebyella sediminis TaxID=2607998 RepID=UPI0011EC40A1|nr:SDR family oxidoreductase [Pareuzebyella sediminis]